MVEMNTTSQELLERHRALTRLPLSIRNARELGGIVLRDGRRVRRGLLLRTTRLYDALLSTSRQWFLAATMSHAFSCSSLSKLRGCSTRFMNVAWTASSASAAEPR